MGIRIRSKGNYNKVTSYLLKNLVIMDKVTLKKYAEIGLAELKNNTPKDSGKTADSWYYKIENYENRYSINYYNSNYKDNVPIAIILQYGHGTGTGGWVEGIDYINPSLKPVFDDLIDKIWKEVTSNK